MNRRSRRDLLQNAAIAGLALSALLLMLLVVSYESGRHGQLPSLNGLLPQTPAGQTPPVSDLTAMAAPVDLVVTSEYGRGGCLLAGGDQAMGEQLLRLVREAMGSAAGAEEVTEEVFRAALNGPGIYCDYLTALPADLLASRLGVELTGVGAVRRILLSAEEEQVRLYLWDGQGPVLRCATALPPGVVREAAALFDTDGTFFAFDSPEDYGHLDPYSVLRTEKAVLPALDAVPAAPDLETLLDRLNFNVHTHVRYPLSDGTVVIEEAPRTLRVHPDGTVRYTGGTSPAEGLLAAAAPREEPGAVEAVLAVGRLVSQLHPDAGDAVWYLSGCEETAEGCRVSMDYLVGGVPVYFSDDRPALEAEISGGAIVSFTLRCRRYTQTQESAVLLPVRQAAAVAEDYPGAYLTLGHVDFLSACRPQWLCRGGGAAG